MPRHNYYGFADHNFLRTNVDIGTVRVEHDLGDHGLLRNVVRYAHYERKWQITEPQVNNASAGTITPQTPLDQVMVNRNQLAGNSDEAQLWDQADITLTGKLLGIRQTAVLGAEGGRESSDPTRVRIHQSRRASIRFRSPACSIPIPISPFPEPSIRTPRFTPPRSARLPICWIPSSWAGSGS